MAFYGYAICRVISEKTGCQRIFYLERGRALSAQRKGQSAVTMTLADRWNASKDGESCRKRCFIDARCGTYAESIGHLSMLDMAPFVKAEVRTAFEFFGQSFVTVRKPRLCENTRQNCVFADTCMLRCKYAILRRTVVRYFLKFRIIGVL